MPRGQCQQRMKRICQNYISSTNINNVKMPEDKNVSIIFTLIYAIRFHIPWTFSLYSPAPPPRPLTHTSNIGISSNHKYIFGSKSKYNLWIVLEFVEFLNYRCSFLIFFNDGYIKYSNNNLLDIFLSKFEKSCQMLPIRKRQKGVLIK